MTSLLADALAHNVWATLRLIDVCRNLTPDQLDATAPGTYGSIVATLRHLVASDASYLSLLAGGERSEVEEESLDLATMRAVMEENGPMWHRLLETDLDPTTEVVRHRDDGSTSTAPMGIRLAQVVHHGSDHRSQICTILTTLGIEPPGIDVWDMALEQGRLVQTEPTDG